MLLRARLPVRVVSGWSVSFSNFRVSIGRISAVPFFAVKLPLARPASSAIAEAVRPSSARILVVAPSVWQVQSCVGPTIFPLPEGLRVGRGFLDVPDAKVCVCVCVCIINSLSVRSKMIGKATRKVKKKNATFYY